MMTLMCILNKGWRAGANILGETLKTRNIHLGSSLKFQRMNMTGVKLDKLLLTPLINSGDFSISQIRDKAGVDMTYLTNDPSLTRPSYSGYFTVNTEFNSNLFFWFFPAKENASEAPLILWLNGGPGSSSLKGLFVENGPICLNKDNQVVRRDASLANKFSVLYVDSPVGAGFSFTDNEKGRAKVLGDVNRDLLSFLSQFFKLFPEYQTRDFYISGESYGGKYVPSLAMSIHDQNSKSEPKDKINLVGITIGAPYVHPPTQVEFGQFIYDSGLINSEQRDIMIAEEKKIHVAIQEERWSDGLSLLFNLILNVPDCLFTKFTGYLDNANYLESLPNPKIPQYSAYVDLPHVRHTIHAGDTNFYDIEPNITMDFTDIFFVSERPNLLKLLDLNYKVLLYSSQCDMLCPFPALNRLVEELDWAGQKEFHGASRQAWKVNDAVAGYVRRSRNLIFVQVLNAGHLAFIEQPRVCVDMVQRFINKESF